MSHSSCRISYSETASLVARKQPTHYMPLSEPWRRKLASASHLGILETEVTALQVLPMSLVSRACIVTTAGADTSLAFEVFLSVALLLMTEIIFS